jgi:uncharacterized beta-barrel protein YwiB (DUF1934 family)
MKLAVYSSIQNLDEFGLAEGDTETSEESAICTYRSDGDTISVSYKTQTEGGTVNTSYRLFDNCLSVTRSGAINSVMIFENGKTHSSVYEIPPFKFDMTVTAKRLFHTLTDRGGDIDLLYEMNVGEAIKLCKMKISIAEESEV